jgi:TonB family protein
VSRRRAWLPGIVLPLVAWLLLPAVLAVPPTARAGVAAAAETPPSATSDWRPHRLSRCASHPELSDANRAVLDEALELFRLDNGGDAISVLETALGGAEPDPWHLLVLAQLYVLAGQGEPHCLPTSGPAAPTGDWDRDRARLLDRADALLAHLAAAWPDDGLVSFLRADAARAAGDHAAAAEHDFHGRGQCTYLSSLNLVSSLRDLSLKAPRVIAPVVPVYPEDCARDGVSGEVVLDLLIDPMGRPSEVVVVQGADRRLERAAAAAVPDGGYQAAQVGYYPVWSWLRVPVRFTLEN